MAERLLGNILKQNSIVHQRVSIKWIKPIFIYTKNSLFFNVIKVVLVGCYHAMCVKSQKMQYVGIQNQGFTVFTQNTQPE